MDSSQIRKRFLDFFKARDHAIVPSSSLKTDDPSVLLTTAGMQQFKAYYTGQADPIKDFGSKNTASIQKSFRTSDIDEVGDESHLTFFEMLGNFSFGGYFKKEAITYAFDFITKEMQLPISYVTVFEGSSVVPKDEESKNIWNALGVQKVKEQGMNEVFWGPTGSSGPCGSTTEIYCKNGKSQDVEVWNIVFNEYFCNGSREELLGGKAQLAALSVKGIDTGMGMERLCMVEQKKSTVFETDLFQPLFSLFPEHLKPSTKRIMADHSRGIVFLLADGVSPSNKGAGYILRRLMRRVLAYEKMYGVSASLLDAIMDWVVEFYGQWYPECFTHHAGIREAMNDERERFNKTLIRGLKELKKMEKISASKAFQLYETFGLPYEIIKEVGAQRAEKLTREAFDAEFKKHQDISRQGAEKKFGGHGIIAGDLTAADDEELRMKIRLHTATHLLNAALHSVLGSEVDQRGSDITKERTRFDFVFPRKVTSEELREVEILVNRAIEKGYEVVAQEMPLQEAKKSGALFFYKGHYPPKVKVYTIGDGSGVFSKELCGGPHVENTKEIGHFRILKEEASSQGVRRIRATVE